MVVTCRSASAIRSCIRSYIVKNWSLVKVGTTQAQRRLFFGLPRALREVERERAVTGMTDAGDVERVAARLSVKASEVREMRLRLQGRDLSLDAPATDERRDAPIDSLASAVPSQDDALGSAEESRRLAGQIGEALARLDPRERLVLELRLLGDPPIALTEVGRRLGVSGERARQLEVRARRKLQAELGSLGLGGAFDAPVLSPPPAPRGSAPAPARSSLRPGSTRDGRDYIRRPRRPPDERLRAAVDVSHEVIERGPDDGGAAREDLARRASQAVLGLKRPPGWSAGSSQRPRRTATPSRHATIRVSECRGDVAQRSPRPHPARRSRRGTACTPPGPPSSGEKGRSP